MHLCSSRINPHSPQNIGKIKKLKNHYHSLCENGFDIDSNNNNGLVLSIFIHFYYLIMISMVMMMIMFTIY